MQAYSKEIDFFRKVVLRGDFNEALKFMATFEFRLEEQDYRRTCLELLKQKLYELIDNPN